MARQELGRVPQPSETRELELVVVQRRRDHAFVRVVVLKIAVIVADKISGRRAQQRATELANLWPDGVLQGFSVWCAENRLREI